MGSILCMPPSSRICFSEEDYRLREGKGLVQGHLEVTCPGGSQASTPLLLLPRTTWLAQGKLGPSGLSCPSSILGVTLVCLQGRGAGQGSLHSFSVMSTAGWGGAPIRMGPSSTVRPGCARLMRCPPSLGLSGKAYDLCRTAGETEAWKDSPSKVTLDALQAPCAWLRSFPPPGWVPVTGATRGPSALLHLGVLCSVYISDLFPANLRP